MKSLAFLRLYQYHKQPIAQKILTPVLIAIIETLEIMIKQFPTQRRIVEPISVVIVIVLPREGWIGYRRRGVDTVIEKGERENIVHGR